MLEWGIVNTSQITDYRLSFLFREMSNKRTIPPTEFITVCLSFLNNRAPIWSSWYFVAVLQNDWWKVFFRQIMKTYLHVNCFIHKHPKYYRIENWYCRQFLVFKDLLGARINKICNTKRTVFTITVYILTLLKMKTGF